MLNLEKLVCKVILWENGIVYNNSPSMATQEADVASYQCQHLLFSVLPVIFLRFFILHSYLIISQLETGQNNDQKKAENHSKTRTKKAI
jgi:hypothetical protein